MKPPDATPILARTRLWGLLFWLYSTTLTIGLLWPNLALATVIPRPDLIVHGVTFGLFTLLLALWNPARSPNPNHTALLAFAAGAAYGGATELLQSIPILNRSAALDDWLADVFGVLCGLAVYGLIRVKARGR